MDKFTDYKQKIKDALATSEFDINKIDISILQNYYIRGILIRDVVKVIEEYFKEENND